MNKRDIERQLEKLFDSPAAIQSVDEPKTAPYRPAPAARAPAQPLPDRTVFLKNVLDHIPDPVFVKDRDHKWVAVNFAFCELLGRPADQLLDRTEHDYFNPVRTDEAWALDDRVFETRQSNTVEETIAGAEGQARTLRTERKLLSGLPERIEYVIGVVRDVTDLKRAETALAEIQARHRAEHEQAQAKARWLKRLSVLLPGVLLGIAAVAYVFASSLAHTDGSARRAYADVPERTAVVTPPVAIAMVNPTQTPTPGRTPQSTATTPAPTSTPTLEPPVATIAPTVDPQALMGGVDTSIVPPAPAPLRTFGPNVINIVLLGSDRRPGDPAWRTDVVILVSIDPDVPSVTLLSFPRDLWVYIPGWRWQRINLADGRGQVSGFPGGGPALVKQTIQYNFGIPVQYYARVDFGGYKHLIDSVGGVDVIADCTLYDIFPDVPDGANDIITGVELSTVPTGTIDIPVAGVYHLDGKHALWFARSRKTTSDFDRSRRQQRVLRGLWTKIREQGVVAQLPQIWDSITRSVETDLTLNDVLYLADVGTRISPAHTRSRFVDGSMLTWHTTETGASVLLYDSAVIAPFLDETFAPLPGNIASQSPALVEALNGTTNPDWDLVAADRLAWAGFNASGWAQADSVYSATSIVDFTTTQKGSRLSALADLFHVAPENIRHEPDPNSPAAYRVIVGTDFDPCLRPSRGNWGAPPTPAPTAAPPP